MINLEKGKTINLSKEAGGSLQNATVGLGWIGKNGKDLDLDSFVALRDNKGNNIDFVYFRNLDAKGIHHNGDDLVGGGGVNDPNETIDINLNKLSSEVHEVICGLFIFSGAKNLSKVDSAFVKITDSNSHNDLVKFDIKESFGKAKSVIVGTLKRNGSEWDFISNGEPLNESYDDIKDRFTKRSSQSGGIFRRLLG